MAERVTITKDGESITVSEKAFRLSYAPLGYVLAEKVVPATAVEESPSPAEEKPKPQRKRRESKGNAK